MKYFSEQLNRMFDTEEALIDAEMKATKAEQAKKAAEEKKNAERKARAAEVDAAYKAVIEARKKYNETLSAFCKDYGAYHCTVTADEANKLLNNFENSFHSGLAGLAKALDLL